MTRNLFKWVQILSLIAGVALFVFLIQQTGLRVIAEYLGALGWGFVFVLALSALRNLARAGSWYYAIDPNHRNVDLVHLTNVMLAGEAIKYLTSTGPFLGEPAKAAMLRSRIPLLHGFSSIVVENLTYYLSVFLMMLAAVPALAALMDLPRWLDSAVYVVPAIIVATVVAVSFGIRGRWHSTSRLMGWLARHAARGWNSKLAAGALQVRSLEENVYSFYSERAAVFYLILFLNLVSHLINVVEVYVILLLMELPASIWAGFVIEAATKVINMVFFFVPTRAGVYESGNALVLAGLGMGAGAGVVLAIVRKVRAFFWAGWGLAVIGLVTLRDRRERAA